MRRTRKLLVTGLVIGAAALLIAWNTNAQTAEPALGVAEAKRQAPNLVDQPVAVRGLVVAPSVVSNGTLVESFVIEDGAEQLRVQYGLPPPDGFGPKDVVVKGLLIEEPDGSVVLRASSIQVGCSSKY